MDEEYWTNEEYKQEYELASAYFWEWPGRKDVRGGMNSSVGEGLQESFYQYLKQYTGGKFIHEVAYDTVYDYADGTY